MDRATIIQNAVNIRGIAYQDKYSANNCSYDDLKLGHDNGRVGCNGKLTLGASTTTAGDLVVVKANDEKRKYMSIGVLETRLEECDLWHNHGGLKWKYNFTYKPLTKIFEITPKLREKVDELGAKHNCNAKNFFNARFCSVKLKAILLDLVLEDAI
jgi:hypothetical protein